MIRKIFVLFTVVVAASVCSCSSVRDRMADIPQPTADEALVNHIDQRLRSDPTTAKLNLGISSSDGIITLTGRIDELVVRSRAVSLVRGTPGVRGVIDNTMGF